MKRILLWLPALLAACAHVQPNADATTSLVAAERAFAFDAETHAANEAFLKVMAPDAVLMRATPVNGPAYHQDNPIPKTTLLRWTPTYAETSSDGSLGFTTGPYEVGRRGAAIAATGHFVSVWRNLHDKWVLVLDGGVPGSIEVSVDSAPPLLRTRMNMHRFDPDTVSLMQTDKAGLAAGATAQRAIVARSGDFGYVYGTVPATGKQTALGYVHIYRRGEDGKWQLIIDSLDPHVR